MTAFVMDVNVAIAANYKAPQADSNCILACIDALIKIRMNIICIDSDDHIFSEYRRYLSMSGQPGVGDEFIFWLHHNRWNDGLCEQVTISEINDVHRRFDEFPDDPSLVGFDLSDQKYVAVAICSAKQPIIINALDSDWLHFNTALIAHGLTIQQLCPQCLKGNP